MTTYSQIAALLNTISNHKILPQDVKTYLEDDNDYDLVATISKSIKPEFNFLTSDGSDEKLFVYVQSVVELITDTY